MRCVRSCGRKAVSGRRLCASCQERQRFREQDNGRYGRKAKQQRKMWNADERLAFVSREIDKATGRR
jgi:hypothetical protein